jgi:hypothetical protein
MLNFLKRDPARERLKIPGALFSVTLAAAANAGNILNGAGLKGKFSREALFAEVCGYHTRTVIVTMSRVEDYIGSVGERFDKGAQFLWENAPRILGGLKDPKVLSGLRSEHFTSEDLALMEKLLFAEKTFDLAASYFRRMALDVSDEDVLDFGRKYYPKLLAVGEEDRSDTQFAYSIRCVRLSHLEDIPHMEFRTSYLMRFNETLTLALVEMEGEVERLLPKSSA